MVKSLITFILSALRWTRWLMQYAVVYPLAMMMLLIVVMFWTGQTTLGQELVKTIETVQREGYVTNDCTGPAPRGEGLNGDEVKPLRHPSPVLKEDCTAVMTDAAGYAAYLDRAYTKNILWLWLLMSIVLTGGAVLFDLTPARRTGVTRVRDARGNVFTEYRPGKVAISRFYGGDQKCGKNIVVYDPSAKLSEEDENEAKEK
ncbi:conjugal transfer protein TraP [Klebsiella pneumoniae]|uniref:conjugal transfer protein TraP n=1 Tax=Klebsiella pneumoniae TaxID=573 RepID=UPI002739F00B|nr:conjugal transfer protein TraP [Klebsiella pneumoniae]